MTMLNALPHVFLCDHARLSALPETALPGSPSDESFERLTRLASDPVHAPVSFLTLVDDHHPLFKSDVGLSEPLPLAGSRPGSKRASAT